jgi:hypothetical protein
MSTQEKARQLMVQERQHAEEVEEKMLARTEEVPASGEILGEKARELLVEERQHTEEVEEKMLTRAVEQIQ